MPFTIIRNDITKVRADAIVNTANPEPRYASGTDGAIYRAAGAEQLLAERKKIGHIEVGEAVVTDAFFLPAKYIIHTAGPVWDGGNNNEFESLAACYRKCLFLAKMLKCGSIAFPLISTGVYGFPKDRALSIATKEISEFLEEEDMEVILVVFDRTAFRLSADLAENVEQYIDDHMVSEIREEEYSAGRPYPRPQNMREAGAFYDYGKEALPSAPHPAFYSNAAPESPKKAKEKRRRKGFLSDLFEKERPEAPAMEAEECAAPGVYGTGKSLDDIMAHVGESFQEMLLRMIDERKLADTTVYKKANLDRKLFSKIRCNSDYAPKKKTAVALAIALQLNLDETVDLLARAGYALSPGSRFDLIIEYCIENRIYDIHKINNILFNFNQPTLGC